MKNGNGPWWQLNGDNSICGSVENCLLAFGLGIEGIIDAFYIFFFSFRHSLGVTGNLSLISTIYIPIYCWWCTAVKAHQTFKLWYIMENKKKGAKEEEEGEKKSKIMTWNSWPGIPVKRPMCGSYRRNLSPPSLLFHSCTMTDVTGSIRFLWSVRLIVPPRPFPSASRLFKSGRDRTSNAYGTVSTIPGAASPRSFLINNWACRCYQCTFAGQISRKLSRQRERELEQPTRCLLLFELIEETRLHRSRPRIRWSSCSPFIVLTFCCNQFANIEISRTLGEKWSTWREIF